jgi:DNA-binding CsgD family transcriptional regulator
MELYQEHYRRLGVENMMGASFRTQAPIMMGIGLLRRGPDFSENERFLLNLLRPHVIQAYDNAHAVTRIQRNHGQVGDAPEELAEEVVALSPDSRMSAATRQAREWMAKYFGHGPRESSSGLPEGLRRWITQQQAQLARIDDAPLPREPLIIEGEAARLIIRLVSSDVDAVLLLTEQQTAAPNIMVAAPGLTRREAEVLAWVREGKTNAEIGIILGTRPRTVAKHLEHIFAKLGVETRIAAAMQTLNARSQS